MSYLVRLWCQKCGYPWTMLNDERKPCPRCTPKPKGKK